MDQVKLRILCVPSTTVGQFFPDTQKRSFWRLQNEDLHQSVLMGQSGCTQIVLRPGGSRFLL